MYQRILVPLDGSELAEVVFPYAKELAGRLDLEIILLHACSPALDQFIPMQRAYVERAAEILERQAREIQKKTGMPPGGKPAEAHGVLVTGYPPEEILRYADKNAVDLILIATHGRSGAQRWAMGSVADKVLRISKLPIWLVPAGIPDQMPYDQWPRKTLLVPLDGSKLAESVLPHVEALAKQRSVELIEVVLLRVCEPPAIPSYYVPEVSEIPLNWAEYERQEIARGKKAAEEYLVGLEKQFKERNIPVRSQIMVGKAADQIVDYSNKNPFSLIIMATHGRSGLSRWVYGSVAQNVLQAVSSSLFLIRPH